MKGQLQPMVKGALDGTYAIARSELVRLRKSRLESLRSLEKASGSSRDIDSSSREKSLVKKHVSALIRSKILPYNSSGFLGGQVKIPRFSEMSSEDWRRAGGPGLSRQLLRSYGLESDILFRYEDLMGLRHNIEMVYGPISGTVDGYGTRSFSAKRGNLILAGEQSWNLCIRTSGSNCDKLHSIIVMDLDAAFSQIEARLPVVLWLYLNIPGRKCGGGLFLRSDSNISNSMGYSGSKYKPKCTSTSQSNEPALGSEYHSFIGGRSGIECFEASRDHSISQEMSTYEKEKHDLSYESMGESENNTNAEMEQLKSETHSETLRLQGILSRKVKELDHASSDPNAQSLGFEILPYIPPHPARGSDTHRVVSVMMEHDKPIMESTFLKTVDIGPGFELYNNRIASLDGIRSVSITGIQFHRICWTPAVSMIYQRLGIKEPIFGRSVLA
jgi:hypothetical protein